MIEMMKPKITLAQSELQDGDILTVQRSLTEKEVEQIRSAGGCVDAKEFYEFLLNRISIEFSPRPPQPEGVALPSFTLTLSKKMLASTFSASQRIFASFQSTVPPARPRWLSSTTSITRYKLSCFLDRTATRKPRVNGQMLYSTKSWI